MLTKNHRNLLAGVGIVVLLAIALAAVLHHNKMEGDENGMGGAGGAAGGTGGTTGHPETTTKSGTYACAGGKSFTLTTYADGTARATGANSGTVVLKKSDSAGIWISADSKVSVRETGTYTILLENNVITRDFCHKK